MERKNLCGISSYDNLTSEIMICVLQEGLVELENAGREYTKMAKKFYTEETYFVKEYINKVIEYHPDIETLRKANQGLYALVQQRCDRKADEASAEINKIRKILLEKNSTEFEEKSIEYLKLQSAATKFKMEFAQMIHKSSFKHLFMEQAIEQIKNLSEIEENDELDRFEFEAAFDPDDEYELEYGCSKKEAKAVELIMGQEYQEFDDFLR